MFGLGNAFAAFAIAATPQSVDPAWGAHISPQMAVQRAAQCGLGRPSIRYEAELQSDILSIPEALSATEAQLRCLDSATGFGIFVELPPALQERFDAIREARARELSKAEARKWLKARGLLESVPDYVLGKTNDYSFVTSVEALCGPRAKGAFRSEYGPRSLSPEWLEKIGMPPNDEAEYALLCVTYVAIAAGYSIVSVANGAYVQ